MALQGPHQVAKQSSMTILLFLRASSHSVLLQACQYRYGIRTWTCGRARRVRVRLLSHTTAPHGSFVAGKGTGRARWDGEVTYVVMLWTVILGGVV